MPREPLVIGVLLGEGIGPEVVAAALDVLDAVTTGSGVPVKICDVTAFSCTSAGVERGSNAGSR